MVEKACAYNLEELATNQKIDEEISFTFYCLILFAFVFCVLPLKQVSKAGMQISNLRWNV